MAGRRRAIRHILVYAGLAPFRLAVLFPLVGMVITAFKHERDLYAMGFPLWFHEPSALKHFHLTVPPEIEEAAWIDGCGVGGGLLRVVLPLSLPGIVTTAIFAFTLSMQDYLYAVVFSSPVEQKVITVSLSTMLIRGDIFFWGSLMAGALLVGVPTALVFNLVLDRFVRGLTGA